MSLVVLEPGTATRIVDLGRPGGKRFGVPLGGAADRASLALANALVGNDPYAPGLEIALAGPTLRAESDVAIACVGAPFRVLPERPGVGPNRVWTMTAGDVVRFAAPPLGLRATLAIVGGFASPEILGSRSGLATVPAGATFPTAPRRVAARALAPDCRFVPQGRTWQLRVLPGLQRSWFPDVDLEAMTFVPSSASDRMGARLDGPKLPFPDREMVSEPVCPGTVQVTREGQPIILGVDGQTIGGYPRIAQTIQADLDAVGQIRPGDFVRFRFVDLAEADAAWAERESALADWLAHLRLTLDGI